MNEDFLHYIWKFQQFNSLDLTSSGGEPIQVIKTGLHNQNAGPDFLDARIRIGDTIWAGNVEIHVASSDWLKHNHQTDKAYDNVILHVVYTNDAEIPTSTGELISTLCIKDLFDYQTYRYYKSWQKSAKFIPCEGMVENVAAITKSSAVEHAAIARLETKSTVCIDHLHETKGDIEETLYRVLLRSFGMKVNALPFEHLARITPLDLVRKTWDSEYMLQALFLGQAGFLEAPKERHPDVLKLQKDYIFLAAKYNLKPMPVSAWKLFRLRPQNFPQVRLAQIARFYHSWKSIGQKVIETHRAEDLLNLFDITLDGDFWLHHYTLDRASTPVAKSIGGSASVSLLINGIVPFLVALSNYNKDNTFRDRAFSILEELPPESNTITKKFTEMGFRTENALDTQGIIHLKQFGCDARKCLNCRIGIQLIKSYAETS
jgi:hypothetical protein